MERLKNESVDAYRARRAEHQYWISKAGRRARRVAYGDQPHTREGRKSAPGEFPLTEDVPVKGTNQKVRVTTFTRYPNYQVMEQDRKSQLAASER